VSVPVSLLGEEEAAILAIIRLEVSMHSDVIHSVAELLET
jgi:hypothetical protein